MPRDANGNTTPLAGTLVSLGQTLQPSQHNPMVNDVYAMMTESLSRNGQGPMLADLDMGGFKVKNLAAGTSANDAVRVTDVDGKQIYSAKSANYTAVLADNNAFFNVTATGITISLTAAATLGANWHCIVYANGFDVTIDPNGAELINGAATLVLKNGNAAYITCTGTAFVAAWANKRDIYQPLFTIASATTADLSTVSTEEGTITGTTTITGLGAAPAGTVRNVYFGGALTLTHNGTSLILPTGANITTAAGDRASFVSLGSGNWRCVSYLPVNNMTPNGITRFPAIATTSGTNIDFTGISASAKKITITFNGVSTNGTSLPQIQIGSGSVETTGYVSGALLTSSANSTVTNATTGFICNAAGAATYEYRGHILLTNISGNIWVSSGTLNTSASGGAAQVSILGGNKTLSGVLDRIRLTTVNGTDAFDAGSMTIMVE